MESILKTELFEKGYTSFHLKDFNEEMYNELVRLFPKEKLVPERFKELRASIIELKQKSPYGDSISKNSFEELEVIKKDILQNYTDGINNSVDQIWYLSGAPLQHQSCEIIVKPLMDYFYKEQYNGAGSSLTMYNDGCYLLNHQDAVNGAGDRGHCVILVYLSYDYKKGKGGELLVGNELEVEPIFGNVAILDFTKHNPYHAVKEVKGYNRFCYISFC